MQPGTRNAYLETQVMTATPQRLRLMLIDGAICFASAALEAWKENNREKGDAALGRCRAIVAELLGSIRIEDSPVAGKVAAIYEFLYRTLIDATLRQDAAKIEEVLGVLQIERETWDLLCRQMPEAPEAPDRSQEQQEITAGDMQPIFSFGGNSGPAFGTPHGIRQPTASSMPGGFSIDA